MRVKLGSVVEANGFPVYVRGLLVCHGGRLSSARASFSARVPRIQGGGMPPRVRPCSPTLVRGPADAPGCDHKLVGPPPDIRGSNNKLVRVPADVR